jgi:hypothetical protein
VKDLKDALRTAAEAMHAARILVDALSLGASSPLRISGLGLIRHYLTAGQAAIRGALAIADRL